MFSLSVKALFGGVMVEYPKAINFFELPSCTDAPLNIKLARRKVLEIQGFQGNRLLALHGVGHLG